MIHENAVARITGTVMTDAELELKTAAVQTVPRAFADAAAAANDSADQGTVWTDAELEWEGR